MRRNSFYEAKVSLLVLSSVLLIAILFYLVATMFTSMGYGGKDERTDATIEQDGIVIILDAGHGGEDPGATENGLIEKDLNLDVALKLDGMLRSSGYNTVLTRREDVLLYRAGEESKKKHFDLKNRVSFAESYDNAIFVSIHMNKFPIEYCKGLQTFYSENNPMSKELALSIQDSSKFLQKDNRRDIKDGTDSIYLLSNLDIPTVLVECGFISNSTESLLLADNNYRNLLAFSLYCGITEYLEVK